MSKVDRGTTETRNKLSPDPIMSLLKAKKLDLDHINAVDEIEYSFRLITDATSKIKVHVVERMSPSHSGDYQSYHDMRLEQSFKRWANGLQERKLNLSSALDIIVHRHSPHKVDRERRQRNGTAMLNLVKALDLYCYFRGWKHLT